MATKRVMGREVAGKHGVVLADDLNASLGNIDKQISEGLAAASAEVTTLSETVDSLTTDLADKLDNAVSATDRLLGRDAAGAGAVEELTVGGGIEFTGSGGIQSAAFTGDVTKAAGGTALTIANDAVTYAKMQNVSATQRVLGRNTSGSGDVEEVTLSQLLDWIGSAAEGDILYRGASAWSRLAKGTAGQQLQMNSGATAPEWTSIGTTLIAYTTSDQTRTSTSYSDVTGLSLTLAVGHWDVVIRGNTQGASTGSQFRLGGTLTATYTEGAWDSIVDASGTAYSERETQIGAGGVSIALASPAIARVVFAGIIQVSSQGTLTLQFARAGASGTATLYKGARIIATRIA